MFFITLPFFIYVWAIILAPVMLESQSKAPKTWILASFPKQLEPNNGPLGWHPGTGKLEEK